MRGTADPLCVESRDDWTIALRSSKRAMFYKYGRKEAQDTQTKID